MAAPVPYSVDKEIQNLRALEDKMMAAATDANKAAQYAPMCVEIATCIGNLILIHQDRVGRAT